MSNFKIGVIVDSFRLGTVEGIKKAAEVGAAGIQIFATRGDMAPENLTPARRKELLDIIKSNGLVVSALCGDLGGHGFGKAEMNPERIERSKLIMDLAKDLETDVVTTHIGVVPADPKHERFAVMQEACEKLGEYGDKVGAYFAIETGPEKAAVLKAFLDGMSSKGVRVNFDPANLVMVAGDDPVEAVKTVGKYIVHTHAKDGIMLKQTDPELIYTPGGMVDGKRVVGSDYFIEVPLGEGKVNFDTYLPALKATGFKGFLTIEREVGQNPEGDIRKAVEFLKSKI